MIRLQKFLAILLMSASLEADVGVFMAVFLDSQLQLCVKPFSPFLAASRMARNASPGGE